MNDELRKSGASNAESSTTSQSPESRRYREYREVPWYRRSGSNGFLILLNLLSGGFIPGTLLVCIFVLTGDIYYKHYDKDGNLQTWSWGNKIVAVILLLINIVYLGYVVMR